MSGAMVTDKGQGLDSLFFELASESRLTMLRELSTSSLKMQDVARKLDLTPTEASRQLQRLSKAELIQRLSDGTYTVTQLGKLILALSTSIEVVFKNKRYFLDRDILQLPVSFVHRLGEISGGVLRTELNEAMVRLEDLIRATEDHLWVMTPQVMPSLSRISTERLAKGVRLRCINNEELNEASMKYMQKGQEVERRLLPKVPAVVLVTEKEAAFSLPLLDGKLDVATFFGDDASFLRWASDLFLYYWNQGMTWQPRH